MHGICSFLRRSENDKLVRRYNYKCEKEYLNSIGMKSCLPEDQKLILNNETVSRYRFLLINN